MTEATETGRKRVVILGGGCGGAVTAFWLSSTPELRAKFKVTLYTRGWRLGGKGASGRRADAGQRIEEHGLHIWLGFYNNAFRTMRAAFQALPPGTKDTFTSVEAAFHPENHVVFMQQDGPPAAPGGPPGFAPWAFDFPELPGEPGASHAEMKEQDPLGSRAFRKLGTWFLGELASPLGRRLGDFKEMAGLLAELVKGSLAPPPHVPGPPEPTPFETLYDQLADFQESIAHPHVSVQGGDRGHDGKPESIGQELRRLRLLLNCASAALRGYLRDILCHRDRQAAYDALNAEEFRAWLQRHGASAETLHSAPLRSLYDLAFGYPQGMTTDPMTGSMAAGVTLRLTEELVFGYRRAPLWKMNAGMGDTIFTPLWGALHAQGVEVNLFHALEGVAPTDDGKDIGLVTLRKQAETADPAKPYDPFVTVQGLRCWPSEPDWSQLKDGAALKDHAHFEDTHDDTAVGAPIHLELGRDFDAVVLAMPPEALKQVTTRLRGEPRWATMLDRSVSVGTVAFQLWLKSPSAELGFQVQPDRPPPVSAYAQPFATWADMSHLLAQEDWSGKPVTPQSIHYFCGPMPVPGGRTGMVVPAPVFEHQAREKAGDWMTPFISTLWPRIDSLGPMRDLVVSDYYRANTDPSELYVQVPPGTVQYRLAPDSRVFGNLYLAGDWALLPFSGGCVETAVWSAMIAAQSLARTVLPGTTLPIDNH